MKPAEHIITIQRIKDVFRPLYRQGKTVIDRYWLKYRLRHYPQPWRIIIGAAHTAQPGWLPTQIDQLNVLNLADWQTYFTDGSITAMVAEHVWEHLTPAEGILAAQLCYRYLTSGGYMRIAVPDGYHPDPDYIEWVRPGGSGAGADDHKVLYTYVTLSQIFSAVGFTVNLLEYFDERRIFHYCAWNADDGLIHRSLRFDPRNKAETPAYTSIILDAWKDASRV